MEASSIKTSDKHFKLQIVNNDSKLTAVVIRKLGQVVNGKLTFKNVCVASAVLDPDTGLVEKIHFHKDSFTKSAMFGALKAILKDGEWTINENTKQYITWKYYDKIQHKHVKVVEEYKYNTSAIDSKLRVDLPAL